MHLSRCILAVDAPRMYRVVTANLKAARRALSVEFISTCFTAPCPHTDNYRYRKKIGLAQKKIAVISAMHISAESDRCYLSPCENVMYVAMVKRIECELTT